MGYLVKELEGALGVEAFDRHRRKAELTPAGRRLRAIAREVIERAQALERVASELRDG